MTAFFILLSLSVIGLAMVGWILLNEKKSTPELAVAITPEEITQDIPIHRELEAIKEIQPIPPLVRNKPKIKLFGASKKEIGHPIKKVTNKINSLPNEKSSPRIITKIFGSLKLGKHKTDNLSSSGPTPLPSLKEFLANQKLNSKEEKNPVESSTPLIIAPSQVSANPIPTVPEESLKGIPLTQEEEKNIMQEIELTTQLSELKEKHDTLERILRDKNNELEQSRHALEIELRTKKDYNKVKDILEKDLKEIKERARTQQVDLTTSLAENEGYKNRVHLLDAKTSSMEKYITQKEEEIIALKKQLQVFQNDSKSPQNSLPQPIPAETGKREEEIAPPFLKLNPDVLSSQNSPELPLNENPEENPPSKEPQ